MHEYVTTAIRWIQFCTVLLWTVLATAQTNPGRNAFVELSMPVFRSEGQLWLGKDGRLHGVRLQLLDLLNRELEPHRVRLSYRLTAQGELPIRRCVLELARGTYKAYLGLGITRKRKEMGIRYSKQPLYTVPNVIWMMKDRAFPVKSLASLKGKRVGALAGGAALADVSPGTGILVDRSASSPRHNVLKLIHGRLDAIVDPLTRTGTVVINEGLQDRIVYCLYCLPASQAYIAFSPDVPASIRKAVDAAINRLTISGEIQYLLVGRILEQLKKGRTHES